MDGDSNLRENDPYRGMRSAEDDTRPDFLRDPIGTASGEKGNSKSDKSAEESSGNRGKKAERNREAAENLGSAESEASGDSPKKAEDSVSGARENEENAEGFYSGKGKDKDEKQERRGGIGFRGKLKKRAPILAIFMTIFGIGGAMFGAQSLLPFAISELLIEKFNSIGISASLSSDAWLNDQLNLGIRTGSPTVGSDDLYALSEYQVQQFKINGIDAYNIKAGESKGAVLLYKKHGGTITVPVVGSAMLGTAEPDEIKKEIKKASGLHSANFSNPVGVKDALDDRDFYVPYMSASKVWRNGTSGWFDKIMSNITEAKLGISRMRWASYAAGAMKWTDGEIKKEFDKIAAGTDKASAEATTLREMKQGEEVTETVRRTGPEGEYEETYTYRKPDYEGDASTDYDSTDGALSSSTSEADIETNLKAKAQKAASIASAADAVTNIGCGLANAAISIYSTVAAFQKTQFLNLISGFLEAVDRVKAGDGHTSAVSEYTTNLTTSKVTTNDQGERSRKNAIMSAGISWLFGQNNKINPDDPSVVNTNFESVMSGVTKLTDSVSSITHALEICGYVRVATSAVSLATDIILLVATGGIGNAIKSFVRKAVGAVVVAGIGALIGIMIGNVIKQIVNVIKKNVATEWLGEDLGNALVSGGNMYLGGNGTSGGQSPGSPKVVAEYLREREVVLAKEADYQRAIRSPFDITSPYTFLGSLAYSILPLAYSGGDLMSTITTTANTMSSAVVAMLPTASAIDSTSVINSKGKCPLLDSANIVGDAFCNPYIITDVSTTKIAAADIDKIIHQGHKGVVASNDRYSGVEDMYFTSDGRIEEGSELAKYITYCGQRTTQYAVYDATIAAQEVGKSKAKSILGRIPVIDNLVAISDSIKGIKGQNWINGRNCIADYEYNRDELSWEGDYRYFQRYAENQRLLEGMNPNYTSPVTAYLEDYYKENPLDTSFEGTLARFSGQTKEDVELALNLIEYYDYIDNYDPATRYAFVEPEKEEPIFFENTTGAPELPSALALEPFKIVYADLRGRYYTV